MTAQARIADLLADLRERLGLSILFISHNLDLVVEACDRVAVMHAGRVVETWPVRDVLTAPLHPYTAMLQQRVPRLGAGRCDADDRVGVYAGASKVHPIEFEGEFFKCRGPLNAIPGPQRRPLACQAGCFPAGRDLIARHVDTIAAPFNGIEAMKVADMKGRSIGAVTGFTIVPEMERVPGMAEAKLHDNSDGCVRDVVAGRHGFALLDGPLMDYMTLSLALQRRSSAFGQPPPRENAKRPGRKARAASHS